MVKALVVPGLPHCPKAIVLLLKVHVYTEMLFAPGFLTPGHSQRRNYDWSTTGQRVYQLRYLSEKLRRLILTFWFRVTWREMVKPR